MTRTNTAPALTVRQFYAAAAALLVGGLLAVHAPRTANAGALDTPVSSAPTIHEGVDWSRVAATPVDTGATVGAYNR